MHRNRKPHKKAICAVVMMTMIAMMTLRYMGMGINLRKESNRLILKPHILIT